MDLLKLDLMLSINLVLQIYTNLKNLDLYQMKFQTKAKNMTVMKILLCNRHNLIQRSIQNSQTITLLKDLKKYLVIIKCKKIHIILNAVKVFKINRLKVKKMILIDH